MRLPRALAAALAAAILLPVGLRAIIITPTARDVERALKLAQEREQRRADFHKPYVIKPDHPLVEQVDVVTEYRRYVLTTEEQLRMGNWLFAQSVKDVQEKLKPFREQLTLTTRLRFHPHNVLMGVPSYEIAIGNPDLAPLDLTRTPIYALLSGRRGDTNAPLVGATLEAVFNASTIGQAARPMTLSLDRKTEASILIDFGRLE